MPQYIIGLGPKLCLQNQAENRCVVLQEEGSCPPPFQRHNTKGSCDAHLKCAVSVGCVAGGGSCFSPPTPATQNHVCLVTQQFVVSHSRHACCVTQQTCLLCHISFCNYFLFGPPRTAKHCWVQSYHLCDQTTSPVSDVILKSTCRNKVWLHKFLASGTSLVSKYDHFHSKTHFYVTAVLATRQGALAQGRS